VLRCSPGTGTRSAIAGITSPARSTFDGIADPNVLPRYFIGIVQRGSADGDATTSTGFNNDGREGSGSSDRDDDILHVEDFLARPNL
jgi:hypothetical protein